MKIEAIGPVTPDHVVFYDVLRLRTAKTQLRLATTLRKQAADMPSLTMGGRFLCLLVEKTMKDVDIVATPANAARWADQLAVNAVALATYARSLSEFLQLATLADLERLNRDIFNGGLASTAAWSQAGVDAAEKAAGVSNEDTLALLLYAVEGMSASHTEIRFAKTLARFVLPDVRAISAQNAVLTSPDVDGAKRLAVYCRFMEWAQALVDRPVPSVASFEKVGIAERAKVFRDAAYTFVAYLHSALADVGALWTRWLQHPWVLRATRDAVQVRIVDAMTVYSKTLPTPPISPWPEMAGGNVFDYRVALPFPNGVTKPRVDLPTLASAATLSPLAADATYNLSIDGALVSTFLTSTYTVIRALQDSAATLRYLGEFGSLTHSPEPVTIDTTVIGEGLRTYGTLLDGTPLVTEFEGHDVWVPDSRTLRLLDGVSRWTLHTYEYVRDAFMKEPNSSGRVALMLSGTSEDLGYGGLPTIVPALKPFQIGTPTFAASLDTLSALWGLSPDELTRFIATLDADVEGPALRALAELCRFIGVLALRENTQYKVVPTYDRMYYHMTTSVAESFARKESPDDIVLGEARSRVRKTKPNVVLIPFKHVPSSCRLERMPRNLSITSRTVLRPNEPILVWENDEKATVERDIEIAGWIIGPQNLSDIVTVPTTATAGFGVRASDEVDGESVDKSDDKKTSVPQYDRPVHVFGSPATESPRYTRYYDAIVSVAGDDDVPSVGAQTIGLPQRMLR